MQIYLILCCKFVCLGPLTSTDLSKLQSEEGSQIRVAYQGVPGAYSESAAEKAYPNCETVPCEQFETAFEVYSSSSFIGF